MRDPCAMALEVLKECLVLFEPGHAVDQFDWGKSVLRAQDIRELNELPMKIRTAIKELEAAKREKLAE